MSAPSVRPRESLDATCGCELPRVLKMFMSWVVLSWNMIAETEQLALAPTVCPDQHF